LSNTGASDAQRRKATSTRSDGSSLRHWALRKSEGEGIFHDYWNFVLACVAAVAAWAELIWVIDCKPPVLANRTPELAQIIRSKAPWRLTLLFCDRHCRTASGVSSSAPLGSAHLIKPSRGRFIPIYIVRRKNYFGSRPASDSLFFDALNAEKYRLIGLDRFKSAVIANYPAGSLRHRYGYIHFRLE
jgi:hypothetical protein